VKPLRNTQLKGMMVAASHNQVTEAWLKKKYWQAGASAAIDQEPQPDYQLPSSTQPNVCHQNASSFTFAWSRIQSGKVCKSLKNNGLCPRKHGLSGNSNRKLDSGIGQCETDLHSFFEDLVTDHGEPEQRG
jgi:hypothetical protein